MGITVPNLASMVRARVKSGAAILGPGCDKALVERSDRAVIYLEVRHTHSAETLRRPTNKRQKAAVNRVAQEFRRLNWALNKPDLPDFVRKMFPLELHERQKELDALARLPLRKPRRDGSRQRAAAEQAALLLQEHKLPLTTTRGGQFHRLAAALYGKNDADLFNHCRLLRNVRFD
jgi:hypothetical protein